MMRGSLVFVLVAAARCAIAVNAGCGTLSGVTPDDTTSATDGAADGSTSTEGGTGADGGDPTSGGLGAALTPSSIALVAGDPTGANVVVAITRPPGPPQPVMVTFPDAHLAATPATNNDALGPSQSFTVTAVAGAPLAHKTISVSISDGPHTVQRPLTVVIGREVRAPGTTSFDLAVAQTVLVKAWGGGGGLPSGGAGGYAEGTLTLAPGKYFVVVASGGVSSTGGEPGGGTSGGGSLAKGGGGFSGLFSAAPADAAPTFENAQLVAGGGGGGAVMSATLLGGGGGTTGTDHAEDGEGSAQSGARVSGGGFPGPSSSDNANVNGTAGTKLLGGTGGHDSLGSAGGGGGGGYYGGGGGGSLGTAGGGGSSFVVGSAMSPKTIGATRSTPGNAADPLRGATAGAVGMAGAVLLITQ